MKNRPSVALALLLLAVLLPFGLLHYDQYTRVFPQDDGKPTPRPIYLLQRDVFDNEFPSECGGNVTWCGMESVEGLFGRSFVPPGVALVAGLILPQLLLLGCAVYTIDRRWMLVLALCFGALLLVYNLFRYDSSYGEPQRDSENQTEIHFAQLPFVETYREPLCGTYDMSICDNAQGELRTGYFLDERLPPFLAMLLGVVLPAIMVLAALGLGIVSMWQRWSAGPWPDRQAITLK